MPQHSHALFLCIIGYRGSAVITVLYGLHICTIPCNITFAELDIKQIEGHWKIYYRIFFKP